MEGFYRVFPSASRHRSSPLAKSNACFIQNQEEKDNLILAEFSLSVSLLIVIFGLGHLCNYLIWRTNCSLSRRHSDPAILVYKCMSTRIAICLSPIRFYTILHVNTCLAINSRSCQASVNLLSFAFYNGAYLSRNSFPSSGLSTLRNKRKTTKKGNGKTTSKFSDGNWVSLLKPFDLQLGALCDRPEVHNLELVRRNHDIAICLSLRESENRTKAYSKKTKNKKTG